MGKVSFVDKQGMTYRGWDAGPSFARLRVVLSRPAWAPMVDTIHASVSGILGTSIRKVAGYDTGSPSVQWTAGDYRRFTGWGVVHIDQSDGTAPIGNVKDVEPGASSIASAVAWARAKRSKGESATVYLAEFISGFSLAECRVAMANAGVHGVTYFVANWGLSQSQAILRLGGDVVGWQYASPTSNPGMILPGTRRTLSESNADLSVTVATWFPPPSHRRPVMPSGTFNSALALAVDHAGTGGSWGVTPAPGKVTFGEQEQWFCVEVAVCGGGRRKGQWVHVSRPINHITPEHLR